MRDSWTETTLGELVDVQKGKKPPVLVDDTTAGEAYQTADVLRGSAPSQFVPPSALTACVPLRGDETILLWDGAGAGDVFRAAAGVLASTMAKLTIKPLSAISAEYLYLVVLNAAPEIKSSCRGTTVPHVSPGAIAAIPLRHPPLPEQRRIVEVVASIDNYLTVLQQQAERTRIARNAVLHELLTAGGADWTETTLGQIAGLVMGKTPPRNEKKYWTDELAHPFCTIADMEGKWIHPKREGVTSTAIQNAKARKVAAGSLMMSFKLTIGRVGFAGVDLYPNEAIVAIDVDNRISTKEFLYLVLGSQDLTHGSGRAIKGATLNSASLAAIPLVLPPLSEQKRIVETVTAMDDVVSATEQAVTDAQRLRLGLLSDLLSGDHEIPETYDRLFGAA